jgi:L-asparaginase
MPAILHTTPKDVYVHEEKGAESTDNKITSGPSSLAPGDAAAIVTGSKNKRIKIFGYKTNISTLIKNEKPRTDIAYIATGGTISAEGTDHSYTAGARTAAALLGPIKKPHNVRIAAFDAYSIDSKDIQAKHWFTLRNEVLEKLEKNDSIVITHGSDTLALTAFFLSLTIDPARLANKTIVLTGSMKPANSKNADGPQNLSDAFYLAKSRKVQGVVCVMNGEIFSPPYFDKKHTEAVDAFKPVNGKRVGKIHGDNQKIKNPPLQVPRTFDLTGVTELPRVKIITAEPTQEPRETMGDILHAWLEGHEAIVYAGTGNGTIHEQIQKELANMTESRTIIRSSKVGDGEVTRNGAVNDDEAGFVCSGKLTPDMASMLAKVALAWATKEGVKMDTEELKKIFDDYQSPEYRPHVEADPGTPRYSDSSEGFEHPKDKSPS